MLNTCEGSATDGSGQTVVYNQNAHSCWLIRPKRPGTRVSLWWERFETEPLYDHVMAYDGKSLLDPPLSPGIGWSGKQLPPEVQSTGGELLLRFTSDSYDISWGGQTSGFRFTWRCSGRYDMAAAAGDTSPNLLENPTMVTHQGRPPLGWDVTVDPAAGQGSTLQLVQELAIEQTCCAARPRLPGGLILALPSPWVAREQVVDLHVAGFSLNHLDSAPRIHLSERFAQLPPGTSDAYFLEVTLLDAARNPIDWWGRPGPSIDASGNFATAPSFGEHPPHWVFESAAICSKECRLTREDGSPFWMERKHTFTDYGPGLRFIRWRDGGRDPASVRGQTGPLLDAPHLTMDLARCGDQLRACVHGTCHLGRCRCAMAWRGELCDIAAAAGPPAIECAYNCSGHGLCVRTPTLTTRCVCNKGFVGSYCSREDTVAKGERCGGGLSWRSGISINLLESIEDFKPPSYNYDLYGWTSGILDPSRVPPGEPVVVDGIQRFATAPGVSSNMTAALKLNENLTSIYFVISVDTEEAAQIAMPQAVSNSLTIVSEVHVEDVRGVSGHSSHGEDMMQMSFSPFGSGIFEVGDPSLQLRKVRAQRLNFPPPF